MDFLYAAQLPIKACGKASQKEVERIVTELISIEDKESVEALTLIDKLNKKIYEIYGLSRKQIKLIEDSFN